MSYLCLNGHYFREEEPVFTAANRSFRYGDGFFESMLVVNNVIRFWDDHYERLIYAAKVLQFEPFPATQKDVFHGIIQELLLKNNLASARVRMTFFRSEGGRYEPVSNIQNFLIEIQPAEQTIFTLNQTGLNIGIYPVPVKNTDLLANIKTTSSLPLVLAALYKKENNYDDILVLNIKGNISEALFSNVFIVKDDMLITPSLTEGCVVGVMRKNIIKVAEQINLKIEETTITINDIETASEIFLTNASGGIRWVKSYGDKQFDNVIAQKLTVQLNEK